MGYWSETQRIIALILSWVAKRWISGGARQAHLLELSMLSEKRSIEDDNEMDAMKQLLPPPPIIRGAMNLRRGMNVLISHICWDWNFSMTGEPVRSSIKWNSINQNCSCYYEWPSDESFAVAVPFLWGRIFPWKEMKLGSQGNVIWWSSMCCYLIVGC